jgi:phosphotransferase system HPr (HPr) family protein
MPEVSIRVENEVGLHARPAADFVKLASSFACDIMIKNLSTESDFVNAKSILSIMTLGVDCGHRILVAATGDGAQEALTALKKLVDSNFGERT